MIGMIVKTDKRADELTEDWVPDSIDIQMFYNAFIHVLGYSPITEEFCFDRDGNLIYFIVDDLQAPRAVTFSCSAGGTEAGIINRLAADLEAKIYDSESGDFVQL